MISLSRPSLLPATATSAGFPRRAACAALLVVLLSACGSTGSLPEDPGAASGDPNAIHLEAREANAESGRINYRMRLARPFTERFQGEHVLIADYIEIHGPVDLLEHVAVLTDTEMFENDTWTTSAGLRQEVTRKPNTRGGEAHAQLDNWKIYALQRLVIVQAPGDCPVRIEARGKAALLNVGEGGTEERGERLMIVGEHGGGGRSPTSKSEQ